MNRSKFSDADGAISWPEYIHDSFGVEPGKEVETLLTDSEESKLLNEDRKYFQAADKNKDGQLSTAEFEAFQNPEHFAEMHSTLIEVCVFDVFLFCIFISIF